MKIRHQRTISVGPTFSNRQATTRRAGFTLIELLVVVAIIAILATLSISAINVAMSSDRVAGSSRQVQSYLEGARDRAIFAGKPRGVRFLLDKNDPTIVTSMSYIGEPQIVSGVLQVDPDGLTLRHQTTNAGIPWFRLAQAGLLQTGTRIRIANAATPDPAANGQWYAFGTIPATWYADPPGAAPDPEELPITSKYVNTAALANTDLLYEIELVSGILPGTDPVQLVQGIVVDLNQSQIPGVWKTGSNFSRQMDVLFSPEGKMTGPAVSSGLIHLMVVDNRDRLEGRKATNANNLGDSSIITIFTRTGHITTHAVNLNPDSSGNPDPFFFAQTGEAPNEK